MAGVTVMPTVGELTPSNTADTVVLPSATPVTMPEFIPTVAVAGAADVQFVWVVMTAVVPSE